jgi:DNA repair exonuclease SbcCD ATPase subunit
MLAKIPNVDTFRVDISSTKTNKTNKTLKKEISINISKNGNDIILDALSGGQQTGVELIADISVAQEIKLKAGSAIDWMILDEAMDGFGTAEKEAALNMLKENFDGLILIVDHTTEIKEAFEKIIEVEYDGKNSNVTAS